MKEVYVWLIILLASVGTIYHFVDREKAITHAVSEVEVKYKEKLIEQQNYSKAVSDDLMRNNNEALKSKDEKIKNITNKLSSAISKLQSRNTRPINYTSSPAALSTCTGTELYREDAEFLTREAARADKVMEERDFYYQRYEDARTQLKQLSDRNNE